MGFLWWNWAPARVFLGDVGSATLGYLVGFLLIKLAAAGFLVAAFLLPLYFVADATITLFRRLLGGTRIWEPHRDHAYQRSEAHTSELQSLMRISYAVFCLKKNTSQRHDCQTYSTNERK